MTAPAAIALEDVSFSYGSLTILDHADEAPGADQEVGVVGPSGVGKSTLLGLLSGELDPTEGTVRLVGLPQRSGRLAADAVGWVMQTTNVFGRRTVLDNVVLPAWLGGARRGAAIAAGSAALERVGLGDLAGRRCASLSGGERQRVAVARALAARTPVVLADEPTASLDRANRDRLTEILVETAAAGRVVVVATHDAAVADRCDELIRL